jgi:hypothetical protein
VRTHVSVRLDDPTMARVDALGPMFSTKWRPATRSDILRGLILRSLDLFESEIDMLDRAVEPKKWDRR